MKADEFQTACLKTESLPTEEVVKRAKGHVLKLAEVFTAISHIGRRADVMKKAIFYGKNLSGNERQELVVADFNNSLIAFDEKCKNPDFVRLIHVFLGLASEVAEFGNELSKAIMEDRSIDAVNLLEELGDGSWYICVGTDALDEPLSNVFRSIIEKLGVRYDGCEFSEERANARDLPAERLTLDENLG